ncbi:MAG: hypothetical protein C0596_06140 [Marinilabiliales bacterium]|nr:MAG: hypothetical protein C0596_06140 [Marinilabiliales bacterium]
MITLANILKAEFADADFEKIKEVLVSHKLHEPITQSLSIINKKLKNLSQEIHNYGVPSISHIASCLLISINEYLKFLDSQNQIAEKESLEYLLGSIFRRCFIMIVDKIPEPTNILFTKALYSSLQDTCTIYKYDFSKLMQFLSINVTANEKQAESISQNVKNVNKTLSRQIPGYVWMGKSDGENEFIKFVKESGICLNEDFNKFHLLFHNPKENLSIDFNNLMHAYTLQFLANLNKSGLITYYGCKGFYQVLQFHVVDFDSLFLHNLTPQRAIDSVKKHPAWIKNSKSFANQFNAFK